jgi:AcrR family transcriptional regulator
MFRFGKARDGMSGDGRVEGGEDRAPRAVRADAQRNVDALLEAAAAVFAASGVDAPIREIAARAGVGVGTLYRHFPQRSDLIVAIVRREMEACVDAAQALSDACPPGEALARWLQRFVGFVTAKRGLAAALHSGDPAYEPLPIYFAQTLRPALRALLDRAVAAGEVRGDVAAEELLTAVSNLCMSVQDADGLARARRMVALLSDGLRCAPSPTGLQIGRK